jgi:N-acetylglucosaminyl-diphospho-decaprenol L-rhamnosyltransferase
VSIGSEGRAGSADDRGVGGVSALFVASSGALGSAERLLVDLSPALDGELCLACPEGELAEHARRGGLRVFPLRGHSCDLPASPRDRLATSVRLAARVREVRRLIDALRPVIVVAWGMRSGIACAAAMPRPRAAPRLVLQHVDLPAGPAIGRVALTAAGRAERVVALFRAGARALDPGGVLGERLHVAHPGIDAERFRPAEQPEGPLELLFLGPIVDWNRPDFALEVAALAAQEMPELRLTVAGAPRGPRGRALLERLRERASLADLTGRVEFAGHIEDSRPLLRRASCLLHCAAAEPFGRVLLEALASARPILAPQAGSPAEIVDSSVGRLYTPGDARGAAKELVELLGTPGLAMDLGANGRRRVESEFTLERARERWRFAVDPPTPPACAPHRPGKGLAFVTVAHNSAADLDKLLESVARHLPAARVVIVDAGSSDDSVEVARRWDGEATVIELDNVGFGRASNRGLEAVSEPMTVLVNPDVELLDDSLATLAAEAARRDRPERLLAPLILMPNGLRQDSVQSEPASLPEVVHALVPAALLPGPLGVPLARWRSNRPRRVGWAIGCCLAARTETLRRLGPFDEQIFLYGEDLDLGLRARDRGVETWFWPQARIVHRGAHTTELAFGGEPFELLARRRREAIARSRGTRRARLDDLVQLLTIADRIVIKTLLGRPTARERRQFAVAWRVRREPLRRPGPRCH